MSPIRFKEARESAERAVIYEKPYYPEINVDPKDTSSIISTALALLYPEDDDKDNNDDSRNGLQTQKLELQQRLKVKVVTGGITNALFCITGFLPNEEFDSVLVRIFGAEGMIDRDVETSTFACLAECGIAPKYLGRFGNGRIEGWLDHYFPLSLADLKSQDTGEAIAVQMAKLHFGFCVPSELREWHNEEEPGLWTQLFSWMEQAQKVESYKTAGDDERAANNLDLPGVAGELNWLKNEVIPKDSTVAFCHNDALAGNIMKHEHTKTIQLIDFEYGGANYISFDIANHLNEYAGGTSVEENGVPNYQLLPSQERQTGFITAYVRAARLAVGNSCETKQLSEEEEIESLLKEVRGFILANHLYWGLWAVNQASVEGTDEFDYMTYAINRFAQYFVVKKEFVHIEIN